MESSNGWTTRSWSVYNACWTMPDFKQVLGPCSLSGGLSQELYPDAIGSRHDSVGGLAWEEAIFEASPCLRMLGLHARSERETKEAGLRSHYRRIRWVQCIDYALLRIRSIGHDASPLLRCSIQRREAVHSTKCCRWSDLEWALLQRCHQGTHTQLEGIWNVTANWRWKIWTPNGLASGWGITSEAKEEVTRIGWPWVITCRCMESAGWRKSPKQRWQVGRVCTIDSQR